VREGSSAEGKNGGVGAELLFGGVTTVDSGVGTNGPVRNENGGWDSGGWLKEDDGITWTLVGGPRVSR